MSGAPPPPPPPPHGDGSNPKASGLPPGNYDIFIIPPHSAGSGFLYLPSLRVQTNSFIAGCISTALVWFIWTTIAPAVKAWTRSVSQSGGGVGVLILVLAVGFAGWSMGQQGGSGRGPGGGGAGAGARTGFGAGSSPNTGAGNTGAGGSHSAGGQQSAGGAHGGFGGGFGRQYAASSPPPPGEEDPFDRYRRARTQASEAGDSERPRPQPRSFSNASANWQKAREETRKREEERKKAEDDKKRQAEEAKKKEEEDRKKRAEAEKAKWEQMRARERETREREAREKQARERMEKEKEKAKASAPTFGVGERTNPYAEATPKPTANTASPRKHYEKPTATSYAGTETEQSYRPYDRPPGPKHQSSQSSFVESECSYDAQSHSTTPTSPPPSQRGPYSTKDPDKVMIKGVYQFSDSFTKPIATLVSGEGGITDGLILRITTEGMFVDDDKKGQGLRQWDVKAWTMKSVEVFPSRVLSKLDNPLKDYPQTITKNSLHVVRATIRDAENKKYVFVVPEAEEWKVAVGLQRLRRGPLVRSFTLTPMAPGDATKLLGMLGWA